MIVRKDLLHKAEKSCPLFLDWTEYETYPDTYLSTPPIWSIYVTCLFVSYMNQLGGVPHFDRLSDIKSRMIYDCVDNSKGYFTNSTEKKYRSRVNVIVHLRDNSLLEKLM